MSKRIGLVIGLLIVIVAGGWLLLGSDADQATGQADETDKRAHVTDDASKPLPSRRVDKTYTDQQCQDENCSQVKVKTLVFKDAPKLNQRIQQTLLSMVLMKEDKPPQDFKAYARQLFEQHRQTTANAPEMSRMPYETRFEAKPIGEFKHLQVLRLDTYLFMGGAHGMPGTRYMMIDTRTRRVLDLEDILQPDKRHAFDKLLKQAYEKWAQEESLDPDLWSFVTTDNVTLGKNGLKATYQAYEIAPYAAGQPTLTIPYEQLQGILKPRYLPEKYQQDEE